MTSVQTIRVLSIDDHPLIHDGLGAILKAQGDIELIGEANDAVSGLERFEALMPDIVLMDLEMPGCGAVEAISRFRERDPSARIIVHAPNAGDVRARRALDAGAQGFLLKSNVRDEVANAIRAVHAGRRFLDCETLIRLTRGSTQDDLLAREVQVLQLVAAGKANKQIADELRTTEGTVKNYIMKILAKLQASDRTHAVVIGLARGVIEMTRC